MWNLTEIADRVLPGMHALDAPLSRFDVPSLITQLKEEEVWKITRRNALTLVKDEALRAVLVVLSVGKAFAEHQADGPVLVHVLEGLVRLSAGPSQATVAGGQMASLRPGVPHALEALEDSALLVVVTR
jgi:quercetin dioxygenase-like cupin family protein